jgi:hypothetical protein
MTADLYPLPVGFPTSRGPISILIKRDGWAFMHPSQDVYNDLPIQERVDLRRAFEAQVALAKNTPTKGEPR